MKLVVSVIDPSPVPARKPPKDAESWVTAASGSWFVGLGNLSTIPHWLSDSICRASTGDGDVRRKLYTDVTWRCSPSDTDRLDEAEMWPRWSNSHPQILGAVLDLVAGVQGVLPSVKMTSKPRMADYAKILVAVDEVLGTDGLKRYLTKQKKSSPPARSTATSS